MRTTTILSHSLVGLIVMASLANVPAHAQVAAAAADTSIVRRLAQLPAELTLAEGSLRVMNLFRAQGEILWSAGDAPQELVVNRLVQQVYQPYTEFWNGYLGDEASFRRWSVRLLAADHPIRSRLPQLLDLALDRRFTEGVEWIERTTGRRPVGTWYIVFGPGWTDMGGLGDIGMVADFTRMRPDSSAVANLLPHELTHQVHGEGARDDPDHGTVLHRLISEGFASYVAWIYSDGQRTRAQAVGYSDDEWAWALQHERELFDAVLPILASRERADSDRIAARSEQLITNAPGAAGYFLGFRLVETYVGTHGPDSWKQLYDMPVAEVLSHSGYSPAG